jgi:hypothetical protein
MPRMIVILQKSKTSSNQKEIETLIKEIKIELIILKEFGAILEFYLKDLNTDRYIFSLFGPNQETLTSAIISIRDKLTMQILHVYFGCIPEDSTLLSKELMQGRKKGSPTDLQEEGLKSKMLTEQAAKYIEIQNEFLSTLAKNIKATEKDEIKQ